MASNIGAKHQNVTKFFRRKSYFFGRQTVEGDFFQLSNETGPRTGSACLDLVTSFGRCWRPPFSELVNV